jgi:hypothetical protein
MDTIIEYQQAQEHLRNLQREESRLPEALRLAAEAADAAELIRLRKRKEELASEIFSAQVMVIKANIARLRGEQAEAHNHLDAAKASSQKLDDEGVAALRVLDEERKRINTIAYNALTLVHKLQNDIQRRSHEITSAEKSLAQLLETAA